jgi:hypothetical protein
MELTPKLIFIIILIILLILITIVNYDKKENFNSSNDQDINYYQNVSDIKKSKITKKNKFKDTQNYGELEIKISTSNPIYDNLIKYIKKYDINLIYNLENLEPTIPLIITYDNQSVRNEKNESFVNFLKGLIHYKYNFIVCGINTKWDGWYGRYKNYLELLDTIPPEQLIFITDSRDVLVNDSPTEFVNNYNKLINIYNDKNGSKIIFGTEIGCCVNQMWHYSPGSVFTNSKESNVDVYQESVISKIMAESSNYKNKNLKQIEIELNKSPYNTTHPTYGLERDLKIFPNGKTFPWEHWIKWNKFFIEKFLEATQKYPLQINDLKYPIIKLNFGMMAGKNGSILKMLKAFDLRAGEDDQHLATEFLYMRPEMVILDYTQILLSNTGYKHSFRKCTAKTMNNVHYNVNFNDHLNDHDEYMDFDVYTREDIPEQGIMYGFDIQYLKYFFTYDNIISYPCFIQSPGKDWNCYNELLFRLPYCDEKMCSYYFNLEGTQRYNIRDIIIHEYKNQSGDMKIEWILLNLLNPLYWALDLYIVKDIFDTINIDLEKSKTFVLIEYGNLLGLKRFKNLNSQHIMPWDDDFDLGWYSNNKFSNDLIDEFFKLMIKKGYEIFLYYKEPNAPYSSSEKEHFTIKLNSENILQIPVLLERYEIVLFNIAIPNTKYKEILKIFNMSMDYEDKYVDGSIKIPSVDIFMYEFNSTTNSYEYNKIFGVGHKISLNKDTILPIAKSKYNILELYVPNNLNSYLYEVYIKNSSDYDSYKNLDKIVIKRHITLDDNEKFKEIDKINSLNLSVNDKNIILITKIYNNFINKYYEIIKNNDSVKNIISSK